ncbi:hypothetical protein GGTG_09352 [Gaeumannomyces tritici R3-111a-1]|uniref:Uncharacterized protein n=1 Tax=Gaeumannomyces tritici (strain R3-111a-1) TaxID=644352 RepID=J3P755_GAET3|nr:hypothetical protein GGTG_09352 [Gaeumannomyces tritici R3-111a-1]EJT72486.1 hypothetical protein GGTG_09352 [Gaeumannomyces tritici R3-111a-1]
MATSFDSWYWLGNSDRDLCPGVGLWKCKAPDACARDPTASKWYCCNAKSDGYQICWRGKTSCSNNGPILQCDIGQKTWCCLEDSMPFLESAYSSLSSAAAATAIALSFDPLSLISLTAAPPTVMVGPGTGRPPRAPSRTQQVPRPPPPAPALPTPRAAGWGGGAIAGIAVGVAAGLALVAVGIFLLWRRGRPGAYAKPGNHPGRPKLGGE